MTDKTNKNNTDSIENAIKMMKKMVMVVVIITVGVVLYYISIFHKYTISLNTGDWGNLGAYIGGILSPACAFAALIMLFNSINIQSKELQLSRQALDNQNSLIEKQNFEATFFKMLELHNEVIQLITYDFDTSEVTGRRAISEICKQFKTHHFKEDELFHSTDKVKEDAYAAFYKKYGHEIGHYFRVIYNILKFVKNSKLNYKDQKIYTDLLRAQLSNDELYLLFHNVLYFTGKGAGQMYVWIVEYNIFKHLEDEMSGKSDFAKLTEMYQKHLKFKKEISNIM